MSIWSNTSGVVCSGRTGPRRRTRTEARGALGILAAAAAAGLGALLAAPLGAPLAAQGTEDLDAGRFEIRVDGRRTAVENFAIRRQGRSVRAAARITRQNGEQAPLEVMVDVDGSSFRPGRILLRGPIGSVSGVEGAWEGDRLRLHVTSDAGERWREFLTRGPVAVLEPGVAHHYYLLFRQLPERPDGARIRVILPSSHADGTATVRRTGSESVRIGEEDREATRYEVDVDGTRHTVWLDAGGRVVRVAFADGSVAVRMAAEG